MCVNRVFHTIRDGLLSLFVTDSLQNVDALTKEEKAVDGSLAQRQIPSHILVPLMSLMSFDSISPHSLLKFHFRLKEKTPDLFQRAWIKSARVSVNVRKATGLQEDEEPETNEKFLSLSPYIENFVDKLIIEFRCNDAKVIESCRKLGARHVLIENFHTNFWDIFLGNLIQIIVETHAEREHREIAAICEKFCSFLLVLCSMDIKSEYRKN
ncbi:BMA-GLB-10 [Dirofilaria immitis]|nr:BMA-GLB-10 [Dirofilaria immitis]